MLTGAHPFDPEGTATDEEMSAAIKRAAVSYTERGGLCAHLSPSAVDLIQGLLEPDKTKRMTAAQMLEHPWIQGLSVGHDVVIKDSDKVTLTLTSALTSTLP